MVSYYPQRLSIKWNISASQAPPLKGYAPINSTTYGGGENQTFKALTWVEGDQIKTVKLVFHYLIPIKISFFH